MDEPPKFKKKPKTKNQRRLGKRNPKKGGRPTLFKESMIEQSRNLVLMGYTHEKIAKFYNIGMTALYRWKTENLQFKKALDVNRDDYDGKVVRSLFEIATGYDYTEKKKEKETIDGVKKEKVTKTKKHMAPNVGAIKVWLYNRRPTEFKPEAELSKNDNEELAPPPPLNITYTVSPPVKDVIVTLGTE